MTRTRERAGSAAALEQRPAPLSVVMASARPIVVGVDGSPSGQAALGWAVQEAAHANRPLVLVNALQITRVPPSPLGSTASVVWDGPNRVLRLAQDSVTRSAPGVALTLIHTAEDPPSALVHASATANLVVVGTGRHSAIAAALLGSTALAVAARSAAPVVVVRGRRTSPPSPAVVVGVDGKASSQAALTFAARWAHDHGTRLVVLHAWEGDISLRSLTAVDEVRRDAKAATTRTRLANLATLVEPVRRAYPTLEVDASVPLNSPVDALVDESAAGQLVVVGGRGLGSVRGLILGSVSEAVVQRAHCPVAIVHRVAEREEL